MTTHLSESTGHTQIGASIFFAFFAARGVQITSPYSLLEQCLQRTEDATALAGFKEQCFS
jgi:hypothetical protein